MSSKHYEITIGYKTARGTVKVGQYQFFVGVVYIRIDLIHLCTASSVGYKKNFGFGLLFQNNENHR